ncbi:predicted protein [Sclerotinia sclerotiorum 1980 UF-70]|uniref:Uncharacterized protein n=1 Tax=Sclerotinia sclerotiorum (strain ATCC 18683 / 1980 / Ss-1) TaxID=665079 RepID=A7F1X8_SCLS1|nr:predicted protein [Sclerotinia sclerotiorum 1980 UF-70]EDN95720.1 predicted protein [Sclerotinia sclerotiorum 1980 UF-70]
MILVMNVYIEPYKRVLGRWQCGWFPVGKDENEALSGGFYDDITRIHHVYATEAPN